VRPEAGEVHEPELASRRFASAEARSCSISVFR
jgi:hypothetical protein